MAGADSQVRGSPKMKGMIGVGQEMFDELALKVDQNDIRIQERINALEQRVDQNKSEA